MDVRNNVSDQFKKCNFYNVGYCRYKERCSYRHPKNNCLVPACRNKSCDKRHPKDCKFQNHDRKCRHGDNCAYKHGKSDDEKTKPLENRLQEQSVLLKVKDGMIKKKDDEIKNLKEQNKSLQLAQEKEIEKLKSEILKIQSDVRRKDVEIGQLENKLKNGRKENYKCSKCSASNNDMKIQCEK